MMNTKMMKKTAVAALVGVLGYGAVGAVEVSASALNAPQRVTQTAFATSDGSTEMQQLAWGGRRDRDRDRDRERDRRDRERREREREKRDSGKKYSQGSVNTAIIAGALIGAIIAKNT